MKGVAYHTSVDNYRPDPNDTFVIVVEPSDRRAPIIYGPETGSLEELRILKEEKEKELIQKWGLPVLVHGCVIKPRSSDIDTGFITFGPIHLYKYPFDSKLFFGEDDFEKYLRCMVDVNEIGHYLGTLCSAELVKII